MGSPAPEAAAPASPKPLDATPSKDLKSEMDVGHSPDPAAESRVEPENPAVNGAANHETPLKTSEAESPKDVDMADSNCAEENPQSAQVEDADAKPTEDEEAGAQPADAGASAADAPVAPKDASPNDVAQEDVVETATVPEPEQTEKKSESSEKMEDAAAPKGDAELPTSEVDLQPASLSQLAIETTENDTSPVETPVDVSMTDTSTAKVAREREDDAEEEPAPKRARTEPKEDEAVAEGPAPGSAAESAAEQAAPSAEVSREREDDVEEPSPKRAKTEPKEGEPGVETQAPGPAAEPAVEPAASSTAVATQNTDDLPKWNDAELMAKTILPFQLRDLRRSMARVKKTKNGAQFKDSVQRLWPALWEKYSASIEKPMDLGEIDRNLRDSIYKTFGDVRNDLALIVENSKTYNGADHYITAAARAAVKSAWDDIMAIPNEEPVKQKPLPKQNRLRESRSANVKPETATPAEGTQPGKGGSPTGASSAPKATSAAGANARRASTADGDRPKRTVRAPKPKDIDYTTKPSRKKLKPELQFCDEVLTELMHHKYHHLNKWFNEPVDAEGLGIPHYYSIITHPMDFGKVQKMLHEGDLGSAKDFDKNVKLVFSNCYKFNGEPEPGNVSHLAKQLEDIYTSQMKGKDAWLAKHAKANPPPPSVSHGSDEDDDDEEEGGGGDDGGAGPDPSREVKDLEAKLREEMDKQANLFAAEQPNQSMITIQQGIVNMVQQALLQAKQKLHEYRQKNGGSGKSSKKAKSAKTGKAPKAGGGGGGRKSEGAPAKTAKASGGGGQKKKKNLSAGDKDNIANAINDLENPHLDRAIDIIKRDTGQMESEDGELELDIDQLSNEALLKLWELCKKVLPGFGKDAAAPNSSPEVNRGAPAKQAPKTAAKPKKNKPMSAQEQEARIAQLREIRDLYKPGQEPAEESQILAQEAAAMNDSSDDSSEEE